MEFEIGRRLVIRIDTNIEVVYETTMAEIGVSFFILLRRN